METYPEIEEKIDTTRKSLAKTFSESKQPEIEKCKKLDLKFNVVLSILPYYGTVSDGEEFFTSFPSIRKSWSKKLKEVYQKVSEHTYLAKIVRI